MMASPWTTQGAPVTISWANLPWENLQAGVSLNEAPAAIVSKNMVNLIYSTNSWNSPQYSCGLMTIPLGLDPLVATNWTKHTAGPVFQSGNGILGPGSGTFFKDGIALWWAYSSITPSNYNARFIQAQPVNFDRNGQIQLRTPQS